MEHKRFFGLHFDFHANNVDEIGIRTLEEDIQWYIDQAKPDYVQCDCKGHPGNSCYPTQVGKAADKLRSDNLKVWCDTVHKNQLPIYVHYSGVWDAEYTKAHPEQAAVEEDGQVTERVSLFGNYLDDLFIPQMKELIDHYQIDGAWIDGDCWAVERDYSVLAQPHLWNGITKLEHNEVMRQAFYRFVQKYIDELHAYKPDFKITSNWIYSSAVPEKPDINVDFISGDILHLDCVRDARYAGRVIAAAQRPWDLMTWAFYVVRTGQGDPGIATDKPTAQLMQEAAAVLALGGGFEIYVMQNCDGSAKRTNCSRFREVGNFVRDRHINFEKPTMAQVGIFYSAQSRYKHKKSKIFSPAGACNSIISTVNCVLDTQYTAAVVMEYQLDQLEKYDIVVVPEWEFMDEKVKASLVQYAQNGGNLLVTGAQLCAQIGDMTGENFGPVTPICKKFVRSKDDYFTQIEDEFIDLRSEGDRLYGKDDLRDEDIAAYKISTFGKGKIAYIPFSYGQFTSEHRSCFLIDYLKDILQQLAPPILTCNQKRIDFTLQDNGDSLLLNVLNMNQGRNTLEEHVYDEVPILHQVEITLNKHYDSICAPLGESFHVAYKDGKTIITLPELHIHTILQLH